MSGEAWNMTAAGERWYPRSYRQTRRVNGGNSAYSEAITSVKTGVIFLLTTEIHGLRKIFGQAGMVPVGRWESNLDNAGEMCYISKADGICWHSGGKRLALAAGPAVRFAGERMEL